MKRIIYTRPDGGVSVVIPAIDDMDRVMQRSIPADAIDPQIVDEADIPADRTFRDAWEKNGKAVGVNMPKAREIHRDNLRRLRVPMLADLDVEYQRADEAGDAARKLDIARQKQALRDVTADPAIDAAQTPDELKRVMPAALSVGSATALAKK